MEIDLAPARVLKAIDDGGLADNTLVVFTSDNGCSPAANVEELGAKGHFPAQDSADTRPTSSTAAIAFRSSSAGRDTQAGSQTDALVCLTDFTTTCADLLGVTLPAETAEDSQSILPILLDKPGAHGRADAIHHSIDGMFAIRQGKWKLELCPARAAGVRRREADAVSRDFRPISFTT